MQTEDTNKKNHNNFVFLFLFLFLFDTSGSMHGLKVDSINSMMKTAVDKLKILKNDNNLNIKINVMQYSNNAKCLFPDIVDINNFNWSNISAIGETKLGEAYKELNNIINGKFFEDYKTVIFLFSDGYPTDDYKKKRTELIENKYYQKSLKFAVAIGDDVDLVALNEFTNSSDNLFLLEDINRVKALIPVIEQICLNYNKIINSNNYLQEIFKISYEKDIDVRRKALEEKLYNYAIKKGFGSVSIVGLNRMGKSSLVYNTLLKKSDEFYKDGIIVVNCSLNQMENSNKFFKHILELVYDKLFSYKDNTTDIETLYNKARKNTGPLEIKKFFKEIHDYRKRLVIVLDEFDCAKKIFENNSSGFGILRQLANDQETKVTFVFISRLRLEEIETDTLASKLTGSVSTIFVKGYDELELEEYFDRLTLKGIHLSEEDKNDLIAITGGYPYWLKTLISEYESLETKDKSIRQCYENNQSIFDDQFKKLFNLLEEQNLLKTLYQIIFGPGEKYTKEDVQKLEDYGLITYKKANFNGEEKEIASVASYEFYEYLKDKEQSVDFYTLWHVLERNMKDLMKEKLKNKYGDDWEADICQQFIGNKNEILSLKNGTLLAYLSEAIKRQENAKKHPERYNTTLTLVDALTTAGLFALYYNKYQPFHFDEIFGKEKEFKENTTHLTIARNPYQHGDEELLDKKFREKTLEILKDLYNCVSGYLNKKVSKD